jgi:hypothetical protein
MGHTKEPWVLGGCSGRMITTPDGYTGDGFIADVDTLDNARRIVACVNACEGVDTENLEMIGRMFAEKKLASTPLHIIDKVESENKRLREALKPFAKFANEMKKMGGTFPKTGTVYGLNVLEDHGAELTVEDFNQARAAITQESQ